MAVDGPVLPREANRAPRLAVFAARFHDHAQDRDARQGPDPRGTDAVSTIDRPNTPGTRSKRVNLRHLVIVGVGLVVLIPGFVALWMISNQMSAKAFLKEARTQIRKGNSNLAVSYLNRYLEIDPYDVDAMEMKSKILFDGARDEDSAREALKVHVQMIAAKPKDPRWDEARRRMVRLNLMLQRWRSAYVVAEQLVGDDAATHLLKARSMAAVGLSEKDNALVDSARKEYEAAEAKEPGNVEAAEELARIYRERQENPAKALKVLDQVVQNTANNPKKHSEALLARARHFASSQVMERDPQAVEKASHDVDDAVREDPEGVLPRLFAAEVALQKRQPEVARQHLDAIPAERKKNLRDDLRVKNLEGLIDLAEARPEEAIQAWRKGLLEIGGNDVALTWQLAHTLLEVGRVSEAEPLINQYRRLVGGDTPDPKYLYLSALAMLKSNRPAEAAKQLEAIRSKVPRLLEPYTLYALGQAYEAMRDPARALENYQQAADGSRKWSTPWRALARLQAQVHPEDAQATLQRGLTLSPDDPELLVARAQALYTEQLKRPADRRSFGEVEQLLKQAVKVAPGTPQVALFQAEFYASNGRTEDALALLKTACGLSPRVSSLWLARVNVLVNMKRPTEALDVLTQAIKSAGPMAIFYMTKATILVRQGHLSAARQVLTEGLDQVPREQKALVWKNLGELAQGQKDYPTAISAYLRWAEFQPENPEARLALFQVALLQDDEPAMDRYIKELRDVGGENRYFWRYARIEELMRPRKEQADTARDAARLEEASKLTREIETNDPQLALGYMLEGRLDERLKKDAEAAVAYRKALERGAGEVALNPLVALLSKLHKDDEIEKLRQTYPSLSVAIEQGAAIQAVRDGDKKRARELTEKVVEGDPRGLNTRRWEIEVLQGLGDPKEAEAKARKWIAEKPSEPTPWMLLLMLQVNAKNKAGAAETIEEIRKNVAADRPELVMAQCYRTIGETAKAADSFREAVRRWPDDFNVLSAAVGFYEQIGRRAEAEETLRQIRRRDPSNTWATRKLALSLASHQNDRAAWDEAISLVGPDPRPNDDPDDLIVRSAVYGQGADAESRKKAEEIIEGLLTELPDRADLHDQLARLRFSAGDFKGAREHAAKAAESDSAKPEAILLYATTLLSLNEISAAETQLARLDKIDPNGLPVLELKARILAVQGKGEEAANILEKAFERFAESADVEVIGKKMAQVLVSLKQLDAAERVARQAAKDSPRGHCVLAELLVVRGKLDEAADELEKVSKDGHPALAGLTALALAGQPGADTRWSALASKFRDEDAKGKADTPKDLPGLSQLAMVHHVNKRYKDEVDTYRKMLALNPPNVLFLNNMAWTLCEELNQPEEALKTIQVVVDKVGKEPHVLDTRGVIYTRLGKYDEAVNDLEAASKELKEHASSDFHLARALLKMGKADEAAKARERALKAGLTRDRLDNAEKADWDAVMNP